LPARLQHAGKFASPLGVSANSAEAKGRPKMANNVMARNLRNVPILWDMVCRPFQLWGVMESESSNHAARFAFVSSRHAMRL
jgi:hypothetical protein